jgi:hypothetical protein
MASVSPRLSAADAKAQESWLLVRKNTTLPSPLALDFFLELVALDVLLDEARPVPKLCLPLASPGSTDTVLALDLALILTRLGFGLYFARAAPEVLPDFTPPPPLSISGTHAVVSECGRLD